MHENNSQVEIRTSGRWSKQEHERFMYAIMQYGKDWKKVQEYVRTRTGSQVRSHAQKFFNKLQKKQNVQEPINKHQQHNPMEFSQTEFDVERELNNSELTPCTPMELVSLIKKQSKEEGGKINLGNLKKSLEEHHGDQGKQTNHMPESLQRVNSYKSMSNILSAYEEINDGKDQIKNEDESFLILLTKKYKRFFNKMDDFDKLIDIHEPVKEAISQYEKVGRKRSFTLPEGSELQGDQLDEKIEQIKKKIKTESKEKITIIEKKQIHPIQIKVNGKQNQSQASFAEKGKPLSTIVQQQKQEDEIPSSKAILSPQAQKQRLPSQSGHQNMQCNEH